MAAPVINSVDLHAWLRSRRSVRRFLPEPVPADVLARVLETGLWAPNAHNAQTWRFAQLSSPESRQILADTMAAEFEKTLRSEGVSEEDTAVRIKRSRDRVFEAPELILLCLDLNALDRYPGQGRTEGEYLMGVQSLALAGGQMLLAAHAEGLGGVWVCAPLFTPELVQHALSMPQGWQPQGMLLLGYPAVQAKPGERKPLSAMMETY